MIKKREKFNYSNKKKEFKKMCNKQLVTLIGSCQHQQPNFTRVLVSSIHNVKLLLNLFMLQCHMIPVDFLAAYVTQQPSSHRLFCSLNWKDQDQFDGLVQERRNSIANALELCLSCANPSNWRCATDHSCLFQYHPSVVCCPLSSLLITASCLLCFQLRQMPSTKMWKPTRNNNATYIT